jgi:hypothetical protein
MISSAICTRRIFAVAALTVTFPWNDWALGEALVAFGPVGDGVWVVFDALAEIFEDSSRI